MNPPDDYWRLTTHAGHLVWTKDGWYTSPEPLDEYSAKRRKPRFWEPISLDAHPSLVKVGPHTWAYKAKDDA